MEEMHHKALGGNDNRHTNKADLVRVRADQNSYEKILRGGTFYVSVINTKVYLVELFMKYFKLLTGLA